MEEVEVGPMAVAETNFSKEGDEGKGMKLGTSISSREMMIVRAI